MSESVVDNPANFYPTRERGLLLMGSGFVPAPFLKIVPKEKVKKEKVKLPPNERKLVKEKLTDEFIANVVSHIEKGNHYRTAAEAEGVLARTLERWLRVGKRCVLRRAVETKFEAKCVVLYKAVMKARALNEMSLSKDWNEAIVIAKKNGDAKPVIAKLEKLHKRWKSEKKVKHQHQHSGTVQHDVDIDKLPLEQRLHILQMFDQIKEVKTIDHKEVDHGQES